MVHTFELNGDILAYDSESGAVMFIDENCREILRLYIEKSGNKPDRKSLSELTKKLGVSESELLEIEAEIDALISENVLFSKQEPVSIKQLYPEEPKIKSMCLLLSSNCNLRCKYCFAETGDYGSNNRMNMSFETGKRAVDFLIKSSGGRHNLDIDFFGGEPLMNFQVLKDIVEYCETQGKALGKNIRLTLTTNAMLLDEEKADYVNKHFKNVVLSADGRKSVQNKMRPAAGGGETYERVIKNIKHFAKIRGDKEFYVRGTYTAENKDFSEDVLHFAETGLKQLSIEPVVTNADSEFAIRDEMLPEIFSEYERLGRAYLEKYSSGTPFNFFHFNIDLKGGPCIYKRMKGCGVGSEYIAVSVEGGIYPCHQFAGEEKFKMGDLYSSPQIYESFSKGELKKELSNLILPDKEECMKCWARYFCSGGCAANNYHSTGSLKGLYKTGCKIQKKRLETALWVQAVKLSNENQDKDI